jgi:hypothetical protein
MTKENWVGGPNARLDQTDYWVGKKILLRVWARYKDKRRNAGEAKWKRKKEIKTGNDFWAIEN